MISEEYRKQQQWLHLNPAYGVASIAFAPYVADLIRNLNINSVCDYGAGKQRLLGELKKLGHAGLDYHPYDPAFPEYGDAQPADLVCCIDVLEHIEPEYLEDILAHLQRLMKRVGFITIHTGPAIKTLPDGRNAHLIQQPISWWSEKVGNHLTIRKVIKVSDNSYVILASGGHDAVN